MQILEEPCSQLRAPLQCSREMIYLRINLIPVVKARDGQKSNVFLPVPCKFTRHFTRRTLQNGNDTRYTPTLFFGAKYGNLIFLGRHFGAGFTRGNHEDVWENMYGDARGILTGGEKGNFVILWFPGFHEFEWNRVVRQDKSCSCAIFKLRLKLKFFFLSLSLSSLYFLPVFALVSFSNSSIKIYIRWKLEIEISIFQFGIFVHVFFEILQRN